MKNTIAEVGIYVLNGKKKRGATRFVMPLYVIVSRALHFFFSLLLYLVENSSNIHILISILVLPNRQLYQIVQSFQYIPIGNYIKY